MMYVIWNRIVRAIIVLTVHEMLKVQYNNYKVIKMKVYHEIGGRI